MKRPVAIDLFSGCGGMSLGLEASGFDIAAAVEYDPIHAVVHHFNFPYGVTICKDISLLTSSELLQALKDKRYSCGVDLIAGGPPCQGFSEIGKKKLDDPRNSLIFEYVRFIKTIKPKYFIFENVPGIALEKHKHFLEELVIELEKLGYNIEKPIKILDASLYGAPQKRKRLIIIGSRHDVKMAKYPNPIYKENELTAIPSVIQAIGDLEKHQAFIGDDPGIDEHLLDYSKFRESYSFDTKGKYALCHKRNIERVVYGHIGSNHTAKSIHRFKQTPPATVEKISRFFKLAADGQCNTLRAGTASSRGAYTAPRPIHYSIPRCITVREAARLHTFPDWFRFHNTIWHGFREIGNAVIPFLAKSIGDQIIQGMDIDTSQLNIYNLNNHKYELLNFNMEKASKYWGVPIDVIPKRKRLKKEAA